MTNVTADGVAPATRIITPRRLKTPRAAGLAGVLFAVLTGLISVAIGPVDASAYVAGLTVGIVLVAFVVVRGAFGRSVARSSPGTSCDSWCHPEEPARAGGRSTGTSRRAADLPETG